MACTRTPQADSRAIFGGAVDVQACPSFVLFVVSLLRCLLAVGGDGEKATLTQMASVRAALPHPVLAVPADDAHTLEQLRRLKPKSKATDPSQVCWYLSEALCEQALLQADGMDLRGLPERARR